MWPAVACLTFGVGLGVGIFLALNHDEIRQKIEEIRAEFETQGKIFASHYEAYCEEAKAAYARHENEESAGNSGNDRTEPQQSNSEDERDDDSSEDELYVPLHDDEVASKWKNDADTEAAHSSTRKSDSESKPRIREVVKEGSSSSDSDFDGSDSGHEFSSYEELSNERDRL